MGMGTRETSSKGEGNDGGKDAPRNRATKFFYQTMCNANNLSLLLTGMPVKGCVRVCVHDRRSDTWRHGHDGQTAFGSAVDQRYLATAPGNATSALPSFFSITCLS